LLAHTPPQVIRLICVLCGNIAMIAIPARKRLVLSNLHHAFPGKKQVWYEKICRENFYRLIELGLLSIACGFLSEKRIKSNFKLAQQYRKIVDEVIAKEKGAIVLIPHFTSMEAMTFLTTIVDNPELPDIGVMYRPLDNPILEKFIKKTRERFGVKLISRNGGFFEAKRILGRGGIVALFFDQNAGINGYRMFSMGRVISSTDFPSLLYEKFNAPVYFAYPRRIGFWRSNIVIKKLKFEADNPKTILFAANKCLENILSSSDGACADWLWAHDRWKFAVDVPNPGKIRRNWMAESAAYLNCSENSKSLKVLVRMPNWLGDVAMAIPAVRMLRASRENMHLTLLCQDQFVDFLRALSIADDVIPLPDKNFSYFAGFSAIRNSYCDIYVSLVNSLRGDLEAFIINAPIRIGIDTKNRGYRKFFFNNLYKVQDANSVHQTKLWQNMLNEFGFAAEENLSPFKFCTNAQNTAKYDYTIGIVCGSSNEPRKRWPTASWKALLGRIFERYQNTHINLYGTKTDVKISNEIAMFFHRAAISNLAGHSNLLELADYMQKDSLIIAIDTGGMHFANMFGCPLICLFGLTNRVAIGPIFNAKSKIVMPEGCPARGGFPMEDIEVETVFKVIQSILD
jgi:ADP-heptose:LPS heptosyltransferase/lauroyl/myristoyl acyltransferase